MSYPMFYAKQDEIDFEKGRVSLRSLEANHMSKSLRVRKGDQVLVGDGEGKVIHATVKEIKPSGVTATFEFAEEKDEEKPVLVLIQGVSKLKKIDEVVLRASESGVSRVVLFISPRSPSVALDKLKGRIERWEKIAHEASKVARRPRLLNVEVAGGWHLSRSVINEQELNIVFWENEGRVDISKCLPSEPASSIGLIIGPEGGFSSSEIDLMKTYGVKTASMGDLILRTESAGSYAAMLVRYHYGMLKPVGV